jgi:hypothetical protein
LAKGNVRRASTKAAPAPGISVIGVEGYKSLRQRTELTIRPLTLLAGANSSGKSSVMQGPLLLKQTLDAPYDPGALLLDGPHVRFTAAEQLLSRSAGKALASAFSIFVKISDGEMVDVRFDKKPNLGFDVVAMSSKSTTYGSVKLSRGMSDSKAFSGVRVFQSNAGARPIHGV